MKVLIITNLFPNNRQPGRGIFNQQQFRELAQMCELKIIAPLPWCPRFLSRWDNCAQVPDKEMIDGIEVFHPRYLVTPKIGRSFYGYFLYLGIIPTIKKVAQSFSFDIILATWAYPDAFAGMLTAKHFKKPLVIKVHGSDVNLFSKYFWRRLMMRRAFEHSQKVIAVSSELKEKIQHLGILEDKIAVIGNGVNTHIFKPMEKNECRKKLALPLEPKLVVFIGNLVEVKGIEFLITAFRDLRDDITLRIVGEGGLQSKLEKQVRELNLSRRIVFTGRCPHMDIPVWMNAADIFCLPSLNEGCPNVVLEALACGTPVVASRVGGIPDMITSPGQGILTAPRDSKGLAQAIDTLITKVNSKQKGEAILKRSWSDTAREVHQVLTQALHCSNVPPP